MTTLLLTGLICIQFVFNGLKYNQDSLIDTDDLILIEAESFTKQQNTDLRKWVIINQKSETDKNHSQTASKRAYIKILPDSRVTHDDSLKIGENFSDKPGELAVVSYKVNIKTPGRYYVFASAFSIGSEDNGVHVGVDGTWPESGKRMQWCAGKKQWKWESKQRTAKEHCGEPYKIYLDIAKAGTHIIQFSMREDGFEMDRFALSMDKDQKFD